MCFRGFISPEDVVSNNLVNFILFINKFHISFSPAFEEEKRICRLMKIVLIVVKDRQKTSKIDVIPNLKVKDNGSPPRDPHRLLWVAPSSPLVYVN